MKSLSNAARRCSPWRRNNNALAQAIGAVAFLAAAAAPQGVLGDDVVQVDEHAPIGVMADHSHDKGELMLSYRFMSMNMDGNRSGDHGVSTSEVLAMGYMVTPTEMRMDMHMLGAMYGVTDRFTAMLMLPWVDTEMDHVTRAGGKFTTRSNGVGDVRLSGLVSILDTPNHDVTGSFGLSFPTGSISQRDNTPMGPQRLPYPMQLGSGTYDLVPGMTYMGRQDRWSWGAQVAGTIRLGENDKNYTLGDRFSSGAWGSFRFADWISSSFRMAGEIWGNVDGADRSLNANVVPTADPDLRGGERLDLWLGANLLVPGGVLSGHRLAIEVGHPVYQDLKGPQLETDWMIVVGWQKAWG